MRSNFLKASIACFAIAIIALSGMGAARASMLAQATAAATIAATAPAQAATAAATSAPVQAATTAPTVAATVAAAATQVATQAAAAATTAATTAATQAAASQQYPACPSLVTAAATTAATTAATAAGTPTVQPPTASPSPIPPTPTAVSASAGYLGIAAEQVESCGARILAVTPASGADKAKLQVGDVIVAVNGKAISGLDALRNLVQSSKPGDVLQMTYFRDGKQQPDVSVTLGAIPADLTATQAATGAATAAK
jgi:C-terminal processing protease CtpA/Prc